MDDFAALNRTIERVVGIKTSNYKEDYIRRRVLSRMRISGNESFADYHKYLLSEADEKDLLRNALTINVTEFLRDPEVFSLVRQQVLPEILKKKTRIRIWCAGCATGEEAYTYAMLARDLSFTHEIDCTIYATDIDRKVLEKAREGVYDARALKNLNERQIQRHFTRTEDGKYEAKPELKSLIRFSHHDLMTNIPAARFLDLVSCRNVTIYFNEKQKTDLVRMIHGSLGMGGYYVMGKTEYLGREVEDLFAPFDPIQKIFIKK
ncbi:protein-glutamate O-methyltransferase CheR [Methanofollis formosanus]|uniref:protein-glutamate O-methyltransferase n=1 Tax=Methanofollis formosanus TaxID=299308 RepID=A0A8G0ZZI4_9EURY|nr:protein-glutamate O-methyltransferase CheR [Methanofollis formosanus]QYZ78023.1 protein-glutamate O-methyltransferase CheR [Methanofollis formosanus]